MSEEIAYLTSELARDPGSLAFLALGEALRARGDTETAWRVAVRGLERHPHNSAAHELLARIHADQGELDRAFDEWDMALRLDPDAVGARKGMGFVCYTRGQYSEAEELLSAAAASDPSDGSIAAALELVREQRSAAGSEDGVGGREHASRAADAGDPRFLFTEALTESDQTALLLDKDGLVLAGAYFTADGSDLAEDIGAELSGVSDEAFRAARHLGLGSWSALVIETEAATLSMAPAGDDGVLLLATGGSTPLGLAKRLLGRCAERARAWLGD
jgi:predicted regulator of Ras-like GTPase activity (Roadblock/LC7/MglB family)/predicted Zn-dependent protease